PRRSLPASAAAGGASSRSCSRCRASTRWRCSTTIAACMGSISDGCGARCRACGPRWTRCSPISQPACCSRSWRRLSRSSAPPRRTATCSLAAISARSCSRSAEGGLALGGLLGRIAQRFEGEAPALEDAGAILGSEHELVLLVRFLRRDVVGEGGKPELVIDALQLGQRLALEILEPHLDQIPGRDERALGEIARHHVGIE